MTRHDAIIVGGGIQGLMLAWEIGRRGGRPLLLERGTLGDGASSASLGIIHGGLRYLQALDVPRWYRSRREQAWFAREFPAFVRPLSCTMPLYRGAIRSRALFRAAFLAERGLARVSGLPARTVEARVVRPADISPAYDVPARGLAGGAVWPEMAVDDPAGLLREIARRIERCGGTVREGQEVIALDMDDGAVRGVATRGPQGGEQHVADAVLLCVGAASRTLAGRFDRDLPRLSARTMAFNLLLDRPGVPGHAIAVSPVPGKGRSYFVREWAGRVLAGTYYLPIPDTVSCATRLTVPPAALAAFRADLARALPSLQNAAVLETFVGILPDRDGSGQHLRAHDLVFEHGSRGGPRGLWTVLGTKLTTSHALAMEVSTRALPIQGNRRRAAHG